MKNILPLALLAALLLFLALGLLFGGGSRSISPEEPAPSKPSVCRDGQTQYCSSGGCSGASTCIGGVWSGCKWEQVCTPGSRVPCTKEGCFYAVRECNACGSAWGPCTGVNAS
ncbi:MAG: hypothetical protein AB1529_05900 [Candidatus Micrarchaeota archaeon]